MSAIGVDFRLPLLFSRYLNLAPDQDDINSFQLCAIRVHQVSNMSVAYFLCGVAYQINESRQSLV